MKTITYKDLIEQLQALPSDVLAQQVVVDCMDTTYGPSLFHQFTELKYVKKGDMFEHSENVTIGQLYLS